MAHTIVKLKAQSLAEIPEPLRPYYAEQPNGTYRLAVEGLEAETQGLRSALTAERAANAELKTLSPGDRGALLAGADLHAEFRAFMEQRDALSASDKAKIVAERDKARTAENRAYAKSVLTGFFVNMGANPFIAIEVLPDAYVDRIRFDSPDDRSKVTILTETGEPAVPGTTIRDLAMSAKAKYPGQFR